MSPWRRKTRAEAERSKQRGFSIPTGRMPGLGGYDTGNAFADSLRNAGVVEDRELPGFAEHKTRLRARSRFSLSWLRGPLRERGVASFDPEAARHELGGYTSPPSPESHDGERKT